MSPPSVCFVVNPAAGANRKRDLEGLIHRVLESSGLPYEVRLTAAAGHAEEIARDAAREGFRIVVAVGGDGTVNEVGRGLIGTAAALGIVPHGSGNGLARHLKISLDPAAAIRKLLKPEFDRMDVGLIAERPFFCTAGIGFDAHVARMFALAKRRGLASYVRVALREYADYRPTAVTVRTGEGELSTDCYVLAFANASQYGNNAYIAPHADLKDGLLDLCLIDRLPPLRAARVGYGLAVGDLPASSAARYYTAAEAVGGGRAPARLPRRRRICRRSVELQHRPCATSPRNRDLNRAKTVRGRASPVFGCSLQAYPRASKLAETHAVEGRAAARLQVQPLADIDSTLLQPIAKVEAVALCPARHRPSALVRVPR
jgi:YegS/Rv2252/BmrU family lipid kinase